MHFRAPSLDHGFISFLWAVGFAVYIWLGLRAVGVGNAPSVVIACVSGFAIFLYVRIYDEEQPRS